MIPDIHFDDDITSNGFIAVKENGQEIKASIWLMMLEAIKGTHHRHSLKKEDQFMKKVSATEILPNNIYSEQRAEARKRIISIKKDRSINLGPLLRIVFENHDTVLFQIQEMLLVEGISDPQKVQEEIDTYNELLPAKNELSAVLFIEITSEDKVRETLDRLRGIDRQPSIHLVFPSGKISAIFESDRSEDSKMSSVHYIRFPLGNTGASLLKNMKEDEKAFLLADHPAYSAMVQLPLPLLSSLRSDLD